MFGNLSTHSSHHHRPLSCDESEGESCSVRASKRVPVFLVIHRYSLARSFVVFCAGIEEGRSRSLVSMAPGHPGGLTKDAPDIEASSLMGLNANFLFMRC